MVVELEENDETKTGYIDIATKNLVTFEMLGRVPLVAIVIILRVLVTDEGLFGTKRYYFLL